MIMNKDIERILFTAEELADKTTELGRRISEDYAGLDFMVLCILKGSFIFTSDLIRNITLPCEVNFMAVSSYKNSTVSGAVEITKDLDVPVDNKHIIIAEDIIDSGKTLSYIMNYLKTRHAASVEVCALFDKPCRRNVDIAARYTGFVIPDEFVVGYGLDYAEHYRNLPYLGVLKNGLDK